MEEIVVTEFLVRLINDLMYGPFPRINPAYENEIKQFLIYANGSFNLYTVRRYIDWLHTKKTKKGKSLSVSTINKHVSGIKNMVRGLLEDSNMTYAEKYQMERVLSRIKLEKENLNKNAVTHAKLLSEEEVQTLVQKAPDKYSVLFEFLYKTGCRINEVLNIRKSDCVFYKNPKFKDGYEITVLGKGMKHRVIRISATLYDRIDEIYNGIEYLFENTIGGKLLYPNVYKDIRALGYELLQRNVHPHMLRHSFATNMIGKYAKIKATSEFLGHHSTTVTLDMYLHEVFEDEELFV